MAGALWDKEAIADLEMRVANGLLTDFAGYSSLDELYCSIEAMGDSPDPDVRGYVQDILYRLDRERAFSYLARSLTDPDGDVRAGAVELLGWYGERITPLLIPLLQNDPYPSVRTCAAAMLGYFGTQDALPALRHATEHDHELDLQEHRVSSCAKDAIKQIKARNREGSTYNPWDARSLAEERQITQQESLD